MHTHNELIAKVARLSQQKGMAKSMLLSDVCKVDRDRILDFISVLNDMRADAEEQFDALCVAAR